MKTFLEKRSNQNSIKYGIGGPMGSRAKAVKQYKRSDNKWKNEFKSLKKQNKILYIIAKKSSLWRELKNIKKLKYKASRKRYNSSSDSSRDYYNSSLSMYIDWDEDRQPDGRGS